MRLTAFICVLVLLAGAPRSTAQEPASQPATSRPAATDEQRLNSLMALIEGQNPPDVRRAIARELLLQQWPNTPPRLVQVLSGIDPAAKTAVATALAGLPEYLAPAYVDPLIAMLADPQADVRAAAAEALAAYRNGGVVPRLREQALNNELPQQARAGAIAALGLMTQRAAIDALAEALASPEPALAAAALAAFQQATATDFAGDVAAAREWWNATRSLPLDDWQRLQIERLVENDRATRARLNEVETRLVKVLEAAFQRASDAERVALLAGYLADHATTIRLLGLRLIQLHLAEGRPAEALGPELVLKVRELMNSTDPREQAAAVRTVASLRSPDDAERFIAMLAETRHRTVRLALINGLGYVGDGAATRTLLGVLESADEESTTEAVAALGRLAERGALHDDMRPAVVAALLQVFEHKRPGQVALCERVLWAMGNIADPSFGPAFAAALERGEAVAVRQAAARGIAVLNDPKLADALAAAASDPDAGVRKLAIETLANLGSSDKHLQAFWDRIVSPPETDEAIRQAAWRGVLALLSKRDPAQIEAWLARLPGEGQQQQQRTLELLERLASGVSGVEPVDRPRLGAIRARIAARQAQLGRPAEAVATYSAALEDLHGDQPSVVQSVAAELLRCALLNGYYDQSVAAALASGNPGPDRAALWNAVKAEIESRMTVAEVDRALAMLDALESNPPGAWPPQVVEQLANLRAAAQRTKNPPPTSAPASQPTSAPASQPSP